METPLRRIDEPMGTSDPNREGDYRMETLISEAGRRSRITLRLLDDGRAILKEEIRDYVVETPVYLWNVYLSKQEQLNLYQALGEAINPQGLK